MRASRYLQGKGEPGDSEAVSDTYGPIMDAVSLGMDERPTAQSVAIVKRYLVEQQPRARVNELREICNKMHRVLIENFSLADILLAFDRELRDIVDKDMDSGSLH
jgi:hypothetical protein